jgi:hypothetical protein
MVADKQIPLPSNKQFADIPHVAGDASFIAGVTRSERLIRHKL